MKKLNFAFLGTPDIASMTLEILFKNGYIPSIVITGADKRSGRGMGVKETPVAIWAKEHNIRCLKPEKINEIFIEEFGKLNIDLSIVVAYGKILPESFINIPKLGTINIHYSLLPQYRGASPLEQALQNGDKVTGITIQQMAFKLDSGPIIASKEEDISIDETKDELKSKLINLGSNLLCELIPKIINKEITPINQDDTKATYCKKIKKEDGKIDINDNAEMNYNKYRAFYGWPGVYFFVDIKNKKTRIKVTKARYENNSFIIERVIPEGRKEINYSDLLKNLN